MAFVSSFNGVAITPRSRVMVSSRPARVHAAKSTRMSLAAPVAQEVAVKMNDAAILLAKDGDFGGYLGPILGLVTIGIIIAVLTPPIKE